MKYTLYLLLIAFSVWFIGYVYEWNINNEYNPVQISYSETMPPLTGMRMFAGFGEEEDYSIQFDWEDKQIAYKKPDSCWVINNHKQVIKILIGFALSKIKDSANGKDSLRSIEDMNDLQDSLYIYLKWK